MAHQCTTKHLQLKRTTIYFLFISHLWAYKKATLSINCSFQILKHVLFSEATGPLRRSEERGQLIISSLAFEAQNSRLLLIQSNVIYKESVTLHRLSPGPLQKPST